ncbi:MAG: SDR family oxidoreductase [Deltaproteobacteria bacterium]|jgi:NADP-dependent 3-hydroxy acid dehydrogenase YdfG|nr:SDR family oxidoreductase [Deltaproteobacteria bacterium]
MPSTQSLTGQTAIVTGASSGIGRAIAEKLGAAGAHVYLTGRTASAMEASRGKIEANGGRASIIVADIRDPRRVYELVDRAMADTGRLDVMVNNAGVSYPGKVIDADPEQWRAMLETNVLALLAGCQAAIRAMRQCRAQGHIVNISSSAAHRPDSGVYGATKHAVNCISNTLRRELEDDSIRIVNIMPGAIATNFGRNFEPAVIANLLGAAGLKLEVKRGERLPDEVFDKLQPLMRQLLGSADDVADAVLYAVSQPIHVDVAEIVVRPPKQINL